MKHLSLIALVLITLTSANLSTAQMVNTTNPATPISCDGTAFFTLHNSYNPPFWSWHWEDGTTQIAGADSMLTNLCAGNYLLVLDSMGIPVYSEPFTITDQCSYFSCTLSYTNCTPGNCDGSITYLNYNGSVPVSYEWSTIPGQQMGSGILNNLCPGTYTVTCTESGGCDVSATVTITGVPASPLTANVTHTNDNTFTCSGTAAAAPTGGFGPYSYAWSTGESPSSIGSLCVGTYSVLITDAVQDTITSYFTVTNPCSNISLSTSVTNCTPGNCDGAVQATVSGGTGPYAFSISGGPQTGLSLFSGLCPGTVTITVVDPNGCSAVATATLVDSSQQTPIIPNLTTGNANGGSCSGFADLAPTGGSGSYNYLWSTGATTSFINLLCPGNYTVTVYDVTDTVTVNFNILDGCNGFIGMIASTPASGPGICDGSVTFTAFGGTAPYMYSWTNGATTQSVSNLCTGGYTATCTDAMGCMTSQTFVVGNTGGPPPILVNLTSIDDSSGVCGGSATVSPTGGSGSYNYLWSNGFTTNFISILCEGTYSVTVWDATDTVTVYFTINNPCSNFYGALTPTPSIDGNCNGTITSFVSGGTTPYAYLWSNGLTTANLSNLCGDSYLLTCQDINGCIFTQTISVVDSTGTVVSNISANLTSMDDLTNNCSGSAYVSPNGGIAPYTISWSNGQSGNVISNLCSGIYSVTVSDTTDSTTVNFVIADSSFTYSNNPYPNGPINDTLYSDLETNCIIDYNVIDSASLYQAVYDSINQNLYVTWAIYSPTDTVYINDTLGFAGNSGYYSITISVFCPNKSGNDFFKIEQVIYFDGTNIWLSPILGLDEQHLLNNITIYPNPFTNSISVDNKDGVIRSVKLIDLNGRIISERSNLNSGLIEINQLEPVSHGTYLLILSGENSSKTYKVIK